MCGRFLSKALFALAAYSRGPLACACYCLPVKRLQIPEASRMVFAFRARTAGGRMFSLLLDMVWPVVTHLFPSIPRLYGLFMPMTACFSLACCCASEHQAFCRMGGIDPSQILAAETVANPFKPAPRIRSNGLFCLVDSIFFTPSSRG